MTSTSIRPSASTVAQLAAFFHRNGYVRWHSPERRAAEDQLYKKGDEVRLVAESTAELATIRRLLDDAGFRPGRPFVKGKQFRQPLYGREEVARFLALVRAAPRKSATREARVAH